MITSSRSSHIPSFDVMPVVGVILSPRAKDLPAGNVDTGGKDPSPAGSG